MVLLHSSHILTPNGLLVACEAACMILFDDAPELYLIYGPVPIRCWTTPMAKNSLLLREGASVATAAKVRGAPFSTLLLPRTKVIQIF
jgi:hypothetical protein